MSEAPDIPRIEIERITRNPFAQYRWRGRVVSGNREWEVKAKYHRLAFEFCQAMIWKV